MRLTAPIAGAGPSGNYAPEKHADDGSKLKVVVALTLIGQRTHSIAGDSKHGAAC